MNSGSRLRSPRSASAPQEAALTRPLGRASALDSTLRLGSARRAKAKGSRGSLPIPPHVHPLVRALVEKLNQQQTTILEVALKSGLHPQTVSGWRYHATPNIRDFQAAANALGYELGLKEIAA